MATLNDCLLDYYLIEDLQTVARTINRPTKHASNPLFEDASFDINYAQALQIGGLVYLWYVGVTTGSNVYSCVASSDNGVSFSKPTLGRVSYAGNTSNNIMLGEKSMITGVFHDAALTPKYLAASEGLNGAENYGLYIFGSADGADWSLLKTVFQQANTATGEYLEGRTLLRLNNGRWIAYYMRGHYSQRRAPGAFVSDSSDPSGAWTNRGVLFDPKSGDDQLYHFSPSRCGDAFISLAPRYVRSTERIDNVALLSSRDGLDWKKLDPAWFTIGQDGAWDDEMVIPAGGAIEIGNTWFFYYTGFGSNHASAPPRGARVGAVTIPKGRIAGIGTTGAARFKPITLGAADVLTVNCNAAGGSLKVELLDEQHRVLPGHSRDDCTAITTDTFGATVAWGELGLPASRTVKPVFVLADATLHGVRIGAA